ncbi:MAG: NADH-quinone oxidoreductase subunit C [Patescibacteria group bacterium]
MNNNEIIAKYLPANTDIKIHNNFLTFEITHALLKEIVCDLYRKHNLPLKIITATDERGENGCFKIFYVFGVPKENVFLAPFIRIESSEEFPSLTSEIHEASTYERKIKTFFGLDPKGHPNPRALILHENWPQGVFPLRKDFNWQTRPAEAKEHFEFYKIDGEGIYEIPVGPIHAGIIEPGHFRFNVAGEEILNLEPRLGFVHKGSEKLFEVLPLEKKLILSEKISGDSAFSHSLAFCQAAESLGGINVPERAKYLRVVYAEMERLVNHLGDIGAIMLDTGFSFGGANGSRLREMVMQINERLTGSRFLRGVNIFGGVAKDIDKQTAEKLIEDLENIVNDFSEVIEVAENSDSLLNRLKGTGIISSQIAKDHGVTGVAGRAGGAKNDARIDFSYAAYDKLDFQVAMEESSDVYARFRVRIKEVYSSFEIIKQALANMPEGAINAQASEVNLKQSSFAVGIAEGWRGDIVYFTITDANGNISRVDVRDPSFLNWTAAGHAGPGNIVPDFPLINKSFNLSYSGNDL